MKAIILSLAMAVSAIVTYAAPASAYVCYSDAQYRAYGSQCN